VRHGCESCAQTEAEKQSGRDADNPRENSKRIALMESFFVPGCTGAVKANWLERGYGEGRYADAFL
jgi:hypothetical protein